MKEIYKRVYDEPLNVDRTAKENQLLGTFEVKQQIFEDSYSEEFIGKRKEDGKMYLVKGHEVSYQNGGIEYEVIELIR